ncbi:TPA: methyltransferase family protein [Vibrio diabolicus]|uniref:methyltransferase family protein n=1 Tax=Vibrio TaxID=662 RepID=UPI001F2ADDF2|nr:MULTISPECIES: isoprenylcysteine carboxylmethyltransferase family protein [Vibrio]MCF7475752.1 isoprenylcysteine carboxylmethyltransferase family protein [Vibrio sp. J2-4]MCR9847188.1 isoprenylcysteine carboxylmethyltransferase family protein [Vibrio antiquarius]MCR9915571.1 isoprenylcysteine carboxylmethyltransferase family protein [Vibrio antiquarius]MCS0380863.1 isoprenylcysteine carboxylmethyltransferase family protein [Vibrio diabolicus]MCS0420167.1 isoprenylcysteine carboxylmethyltrans
MRKLELKVPPVAVFLLAILLMYGLTVLVPSLNISVPFVEVVVGGLTLLSGYMGIAGVYEFHKVKTTVNPVKPDTASSVVRTGVFSFSRNPMYMALLLLIIAIGLWWQHLSVVLCSVVFVSYMNRFQIKPEERVLERLFGEEYVDYKNHVRRWI